MLEVRDATWFWQKGELSKAGLKLLDDAVAARPGNLEILFLRGMTSYRLPGFFGRAKGAEQDLREVALAGPAAAQRGELDPRLVAGALFHYGLIRDEKDGDHAASEALWRQAAENFPDTPGGKAAIARLKR